MIGGTISILINYLFCKNRDRIFEYGGEEKKMRKKS